MIPVAGIHHILVLKLRIAAFDDADYIGRVRGFDLALQIQANLQPGRTGLNPRRVAFARRSSRSSFALFMIFLAVSSVTHDFSFRYGVLRRHHA